MKQRLRPGRVLLYWDYDTQRGAEQSRLGRQEWGHLEVPNTARILDLLSMYEVRATFACVGFAAVSSDPKYDCRDQIRQIHAAGHEIASHSHEHEFLPALSSKQLRLTLTQSRMSLEDLIGAPVTGFVPPFNRPMHYPQRMAFSLTECRSAGRGWLSIPRLCHVLRECGYRTCRVGYRSSLWTMVGKISGRVTDHPVEPEVISGLTCFRLNTTCGFDRPAVARVRQVAEHGGLCVVYGHPHSLTAENGQSEGCLRSLLAEVVALRREGRLIDALPREMAFDVTTAGLTGTYETLRRQP